MEGLFVHVSGVNNTKINPVLPALMLYPPGGGGGGGTPLYGLYRYVPRNRVWFLEVLDP